MASTSDNVDYSFSNDEKLIIHNPNTEDKPSEENNTSKQGPSSEIAASIDSGQENCNNSQDETKSVSVDETITKLEGILKDLKKQKEEQLEDKRIIRNVSNKRSRKTTRKYTSSPRYDSSPESSTSQNRSPLPKRTRKESPRKKYDSDSSAKTKEQRYKYRDSSQDSLGSDRSYSCVSKKLKNELSSLLGNSFVSINAKKNRYSRKTRKDKSRTSKRSESIDRSRYSKKDKYDRSRYSRADYSRDRSRSRRGDSYDRYSRKKASKRNSDRYNNYNRNYQQVSSNDIEERYSRYYAVMYAFSIIMDILRQDDIYSTF